MNDFKIFQIKVREPFQEKSTDGYVKFKIWTNAERLTRGITTLLICWLIAAVAVLIPILGTWFGLGWVAGHSSKKAMATG